VKIETLQQKLQQLQQKSQVGVVQWKWIPTCEHWDLATKTTTNAIETIASKSCVMEKTPTCESWNPTTKTTIVIIETTTSKSYVS